MHLKSHYSSLPHKWPTNVFTTLKLTSASTPPVIEEEEEEVESKESKHSLAFVHLLTVINHQQTYRWVTIEKEKSKQKRQEREEKKKTPDVTRRRKNARKKVKNRRRTN